MQPDLYFHLAAGRTLWTEGLPTTNVFLAPNPTHPFVDHEWLFQAVAWPLFRLGEALGGGGASLLSALKALAVLATFALILAACRRVAPRLRWVVLGAALVVAGGRFILRPEVFSFLGVALHLYLLRQGGRLDRRVLIGLLLFQAVWSNVHGFAVLGPTLVGASLGAAGVHLLLHARGGARARAFLGPPAETARLKALGLLLVLELGASALNPYGAEAAFYPYLIFLRASEDAASAGLSYRVVELVSPFAPSLRSVAEIQLYLLWLLAAPVLFLLGLRGRRIGLEEGARGLLLVASSLLYVRNLPFAALGLAVPSAAGLAMLAEKARPLWGAQGPRVRRAGALLAGAGLLLLSGGVLDDRFHRNASYDARAGTGLGSFPRYDAAVAFLTESPPAGGLFNNFGAGHFLIYARGAQPPKPYICGNTDLYTRALLRRYHEVMRGERDLGAELDALSISDVLLDHRVEVERGVLQTLLDHPEWVLVHADAQALLFRRRAPGVQPLRRADFAQEVLNWPFPDEEPDRFLPTRILRTLRLLPPREVQPLARLQAAKLLDLLGQSRPALELAETARELAPGSPLVLLTLADLEQYHGSPTGARRLYRRLTELLPHDPLPCVKLGLMALGRGDARQAVRRLRQALARDPSSRLARENLLSALEAKQDPVELRRVLAESADLRPAKRAYYLGAAAKLEDELDRAEEQLSRAVAADPRLVPAQALLAEVLGQRGKLPEAEQAWERLCELSPGDASAWRALGRLRRVRGAPSRALRAWEQAWSVDPREVDALLLAGETLLGQGERARARVHLDEALRRRPRDPRAIQLRQRAGDP